MHNSFCQRFILALLALGLTTPAFAADNPAVYHVATDGQDNPDRDGKSPKTAWQSLAYACERVPAGEARIELGQGPFTCTRTAKPKSGVTIVGQGADTKEGKQPSATRLIAAPDWKLGTEMRDAGPPEEFLIDVTKAENVVIRDLELASAPDHRITGGVHLRDATNVTLEKLVVRDFRWNGLGLLFSKQVVVRHCYLENASTDKMPYHGGLIRTRWIKDCQIHHNRIVSTHGHGYGYKGSGHEGVRLHHNHIEVVSEFAVESAHENEYGLEIDANFCNRCISVPKGGQGDDPNKRNFKYSVWIHDNLLTDSYTLEGPRNNLRLNRNYIRCDKNGGRVYTHHGGINHGPIWIDHNVVENADRALVWMNEGLAENIHVFNNTVSFADAEKRAGTALGAWSGERMNGWVVKNNIFIAPASQPRQLFPTERGVPEKIVVSHNLLINVTGAGEGNIAGDETALLLKGDKPFPYYAPRGGGKLIDAGVDVGLPFVGTAPDVGAWEAGDKETWLKTFGPDAP